MSEIQNLSNKCRIEESSLALFKGLPVFRENVPKSVERVDSRSVQHTPKLEQHQEMNGVESWQHATQYGSWKKKSK